MQDVTASSRLLRAFPVPIYVICGVCHRETAWGTSGSKGLDESCKPADQKNCDEKMED